MDLIAKYYNTKKDLSFTALDELIDSNIQIQLNSHYTEPNYDGQTKQLSIGHYIFHNVLAGQLSQINWNQITVNNVFNEKINGEYVILQNCRKIVVDAKIVKMADCKWIELANFAIIKCDTMEVINTEKILGIIYDNLINYDVLSINFANCQFISYKHNLLFWIYAKDGPNTYTGPVYRTYSRLNPRINVGSLYELIDIVNAKNTNNVA